MSLIYFRLNESLRTATLRINLDKLDLKGMQKMADDNCKADENKQNFSKDQQSPPR